MINPYKTGKSLRSTVESDASDGSISTAESKDSLSHAWIQMQKRIVEMLVICELVLRHMTYETVRSSGQSK
eukprot:scaffold2130_cov49-Cyclotella_meneghiniana.AAC.2